MTHPPTAIPLRPSTARSGIAARALGTLATGVSGVVAAVSGVAPHVLHHVGPLAGTALLAGAAGTILFGVLGFLLSIPMLLRLRRRFGTWVAPAVASVIFTAIYLTSALVIGPALTARGQSETPPVQAPATDEHADHH
jgi:tellurite resistance protein TehA-like permease